MYDIQWLLSNICVHKTSMWCQYLMYVWSSITIKKRQKMIWIWYQYNADIWYKYDLQNQSSKTIYQRYQCDVHIWCLIDMPFESQNVVYMKYRYDANIWWIYDVRFLW